MIRRISASGAYTSPVKREWFGLEVAAVPVAASDPRDVALGDRFVGRIVVAAPLAEGFAVQGSCRVASS